MSYNSYNLIQSKKGGSSLFVVITLSVVLSVVFKNIIDKSSVLFQSYKNNRDQSTLYSIANSANLILNQENQCTCNLKDIVVPAAAMTSASSIAIPTLKIYNDDCVEQESLLIPGQIINGNEVLSIKMTNFNADVANHYTADVQLTFKSDKGMVFSNRKKSSINVSIRTNAAHDKIEACELGFGGQILSKLDPPKDYLYTEHYITASNPDGDMTFLESVTIPSTARYVHTVSECLAFGYDGVIFTRFQFFKGSEELISFDGCGSHAALGLSGGDEANNKRQSTRTLDVPRGATHFKYGTRLHSEGSGDGTKNRQAQIYFEVWR